MSENENQQDARISKEIVEQYEKVRQSGKTNMFDYYNVITIANSFGFYALATITRDDYIYLLQNFGKLMSLYNIQQN